MAAPEAANRGQIWIVRLVFYPVAIALIALVWHQRHAEADDDSGAAAAVPGLSYLSGTVGSAPATARLVDGRRPRLALFLSYRCTPEVGEVTATLSDLPVDGGDRPRVRATGIAMTWPSGWHGLTSVDLDGRFEADGSLRGTVSARMTLNANGVRAACWADPKAVTLDAVGDGPRGLTTQGEPVRVALGDDGRPVGLSVSVRLWCGDGTARHVVWTTPLDARGAAARRWSALGPDYELLVGPGADGTLAAQVDREADGRVRGAVAVAAVLPSSKLSCRPRAAVAFALGGG